MRWALAVVSAVWMAFSGGAYAAEALKEIRIDWATYNPVSLVLKQKGLLEKEFAKDGISIVWVQSAGSNKALEFLNAGSIDFGSTALDAFTRRDLQDHLLDLWADTRPTLILVTHDVEEAVALADRVLVMRPRPGRLFEAININLGRPRDRNSPLFDDFKRHVLTALDRSLDRNVPDRDPKLGIGESMWW
jgi:hypothetical protein